MPDRPNILLLFNNPDDFPVLDGDAHAALARIGRVVRPPGRSRDWTDAQLAEWLADADVVLTGWGSPMLTGELLAAAPRLKFIGHCAGTVAPFIDPAAWDRGLTVVSSNAAMSSQVADWAVTLASMALRRWNLVDGRFRRARSSRNDRIIRDVDSLTHQPVGVLGFGDVARWAIPMFLSFGCRVRVTAPESAETIAAAGATQVELDELLANSRVVSLHAPLNDATRGIMSGERLARMPDGAVLVNTARGRLVDTEALTAECRGGRLRAALDVTEPEPLPDDHPLWEMDNVILSPHVAGPVPMRQPEFGRMVVADLESWLAGRPLKGLITRDRAAIMTQKS